NTDKEEGKAEILADSLADATALLEEKFGTTDRSQWEWGKIHTYRFRTQASKMSKDLGWFKRTMLSCFSKYFNRGPYPAGGDHTTLNAAFYKLGNDFDVWMIPTARIVVDFSQELPLSGIISSGQSGNPSSPHYDDGIRAWLDGDYQSFPFDKQGIEDQYTQKTILSPELEN
ncbi:MAG: penicillin acylase family protein, partial [Thermodesulfobacteriota bacterium]